MLDVTFHVHFYAYDDIYSKYTTLETNFTVILLYSVHFIALIIVVVVLSLPTIKLGTFLNYINDSLVQADSVARTVISIGNENDPFHFLPVMYSVVFILYVY